MGGSHSSKNRHPVGKELGPLDVVGKVACLWKCLQACEPRKKTLSRCCWDARGPQSSNVAPAGSHIYWADPRWWVVRVLWESDWGLANENDFWISSVLEAYDHLGGETW